MNTLWQRSESNLISIGDVLERNRGIGPGFDFLRVFLATMVVFSHAFVVCGYNPESMQSMWFLDYWVLAIFFSLSGFLITGSALRLKLSDFLKNRVLRIVPALAMDIFISAVVLGPLLTNVDLKQYYESKVFYAYFLNILGWPHYHLPGLFSDHPFDQVNVSLWTVPWEITCYIIIACFIKLKMLSRIESLTGVTMLILCFGLAIICLDNGFPIQFHVNRLVHYFLAQRGSRLIICFMLGILIFQLRFRVPYSYLVFMACLIWCVALAICIRPLTTLSTYPIMNVLAAGPLVYIMAFIGVSPIPTLPLFRRGDYSYGIYLYGFPIQQVAFWLLGNNDAPTLNFLFSMPLIIMVAICSWHFVEKPIVRLRRRFSFVAGLRLADTPANDLSGVPVNNPTKRHV